MENKSKSNTESNRSAALTYEQWRHDFLRVIMRFVFGVFFVSAVFASSSNSTTTNIIYVVMLVFIGIVAFAPVPYIVRAIVLLVTFYISATNLAFIWGFSSEATIIYLCMITLATLLFEQRMEFVTIPLSAGTLLLAAFLSLSGQNILSGWVLSPENVPASFTGSLQAEYIKSFYELMLGSWLSWIIYTVDLVALASILIFAIRKLKGQFNVILNEAKSSLNELEETGVQLEARVAERTSELTHTIEQMNKRASRLEAIAYTARESATAKNLDNLLLSITDLISQRFGFYHIGIFLLDDNREFALLKAANSEGGAKMLARGHRLQVGQQGLVGLVTSQGIARVALDVEGDTAHFKNPDLPETNSEVVLPLKRGSEIIGALDIQSKELNAFSQEDLGVLSILADQVSIAIQNARSLEQANQALREAEIASSRLTGQAWKGYIESTGSRGYRYDGTKPEPLKKTAKDTEEKGALLVPVQLRGQTIGHLKLKGVDNSHKWTDDELAIIQSTAERVALAAESARLLEDAQKRASRETLISEISAKLGASFQLDSILRDTVEELGSNLKNSTVTFQLVNPSLPPSSDNSNGGSSRRKKSE